ncbi:GNAT family N-acetyltransferase [Streptomyces sp. NRRL S-350]|uniref:GNAT family N-acetyltransferase n=1 Tax=Streptomyces sp. NRRL S-350 TaxID=1463902 RepID=UPI00099BBBAE|nr:GNAT family N-acetyltransferase [Streptomyces sp. NRRL S-350]
MTTPRWVEGGEVLGRLAIRHRLTPRPARVGGHIGYDVRPSAHRRGHATAMLAAALPVAAALGIAEALLTFDETNTASRRVIEANGGRLTGTDGRKRSYLVPTAHGRPAAAPEQNRTGPTGPTGPPRRAGRAGPGGRLTPPAPNQPTA